MKQVKRILIFLAFAASVVYPLHTDAQYLIPRSVVASGGGVITSSSYSINGTIGQPTIGVMSSSSNNNYVGFWYTQGYITTGIKQEPNKGIPTEYRLDQNYPNPFNPSTIIEFSLPETGNVMLKVFNVLGEEVAVLVNEELTAGWYKVEWRANGFASGMYIYRLQVNPSGGSGGGYTATKKLMLVK